MRSTILARVSLGAALLATTACATLAPRYERPGPPVPSSWPVGDSYLRQNERTLATFTYRDIFRDKRLQALIDRALANNRDLRVAAANIAQARAAYRIQRADLFPQVDATADYSYRHSGSQTVATGTGTGTGGTLVTGGGTSSFSLGVGITGYELDLFGRVKSLTNASLARYFEQEAAARATRLTLVADLAEAWLTYAADRSLLQVAQDTVASAQRSYDLTNARLRGGVSPRTDLRQAEQILATAQADVATQTTAVAQDVNALQLLVGAPIDAALLPATIDAAGATIAEVPAGLDPSVLLRRPDVVEAEYELRATNAEIGAARAQLFPRLVVSALAGFASTALRTLFGGGAFSYSVSPGASYPIFRAGAGRATVEQTQAARDAALATYEKAVQTGFSEVADALAERGTIDARIKAYERFYIAALDTARLEDARYRGGIDTYLNSLDAQRQLYSARQQIVTIRLARANNLVTLYRSLGGDNLLDVAPTGAVPPPSDAASPVAQQRPQQ